VLYLVVGGGIILGGNCVPVQGCLVCWSVFAAVVFGCQTKNCDGGAKLACYKKGCTGLGWLFDLKIRGIVDVPMYKLINWRDCFTSKKVTIWLTIVE